MKRRGSFKLSVALGCGAFVGLASIAHAVPPPNDTCSGAIVLSLPVDTPVSFGVDISTATTDLIDIGDCDSTPNAPAGVWWRFNATTAGALRIDETSSNNIATGVWAVLPTAVCALNGQSTYQCSDNESFSFRVAANISYYILIHNQSATLPTVALSCTFTFSTVINDYCANATNLVLDPGVSSNFSIENTAAEHDFIDIGTCNSGSGGSYGVWWRYDATVSGGLLFREFSAQDIALGAWEMDTTSAGCPTTGPATICRGTGEGDEFLLNVHAGKTYYILVHTEIGSTPTLGINGSFTFFPPPVNDFCEDAIDLNQALATLNPFSLVIPNEFATNDAAAAGCNTHGVWFKYVVPETGAYVFFTESGPQSSRCLRVIDSNIGCPPDGTALCPIAETNQTTPDTVIAGRTNYLCFGTAGNPNPLTSLLNPLRLTFSHFDPANNDDCASARTISGPGTLSISLIGLTDPTENLHIPCVGAGHIMLNDGWYKWTATSNGTLIFAPRSIPPISVNGKFFVYDGGVAPGQCPTGGSGHIACNFFSGNEISVGPISVTEGKVYYFQFAVSHVGLPLPQFHLDFDFLPASLGACCVASTCTMQTPGECSEAGGAYSGDGTLCSMATSTMNTYFKSAAPFNAIPAGSSGGEGLWQSSINVSDDFTIADVEVDLALNHTAQGDLIITVENNLRRAVLTNRGRRSHNNLGSHANFLAANTYTWSDAGAESIFDALAANPVNIPTDVYKPGGVWGMSRGLEGTFNGMSAAGTWRLTIRDQLSACCDSGNVTSWTLRLKQGTPSSCGTPCACPGDVNASNARDGHDVQGFVACLLGGGTNCGCADVNGIPGLTSEDTVEFVDLLLNSPACH